MTDIYFVQVDNGQRKRPPYVNVMVDGIRVRFLSRDAGFIGWRCDEHGDNPSCEHEAAVWPFLTRRMQTRMHEAVTGSQ